MKWRLLKLGTDDVLLKEAKNKAAMQMAIDEAITKVRSEDMVLNTLRFYTWKPPAITIGVHQKFDNNFSDNIEKYQFTRRITGGTAVLHKDDLTYAVIVSKNYVPKNVTEAYKKLSQGIVNGLNKMNIKAKHRLIKITSDEQKKRTDCCYVNKNQYDIVVGNKKISGNAMTNIGNAVLQHGTIIIENNVDELIECFNYNRQTKEKIKQERLRQITSIKEVHGDIFLENLEEKIIAGFEQCGIKFIKGELTPAEIKKARELYEKKYSTEEWNLNRKIKTHQPLNP